MSEFKLQKIVDTIIQQQHLSGKVKPEDILEYLQKSIKENAKSRAGCSGVQIAEKSQIENLVDQLPDPEPFVAKYNDLKQKNVDSLNHFVQFLSSISQDARVKESLARSKKYAKPSCINKTLTNEDIPQVVNILKEKIKNNTSCTKNVTLNLSATAPVMSTPSMTSWVQRKPTMSFDFSKHSSGSVTSAVPEISQESILIDDLLNILIGLPGCYIEPEELTDPYGPRTFRINDNVPVSLQELVKQILPLASHYSMIQRFIEEKMRFEFGQVNNALAEAMQALIKDHMLFTVQLETEARANQLNLQKMWFYSQRNMQFLGIAADIAFSISKSDAKGGKVLSLLHDKVISSIGDERNQQLCLKLMEAACLPYMKMLGMWIYMGVIADPIGEFLVEDNEVVRKEEMPIDYSAGYWDKKYSIRRERIPKFLELVSDIILKTGKYLNVIKQCGKPMVQKVFSIEYKIEEKHYIEAIEKAYVFASQTLLDLVMKEKDLLGRLKSVKHYFLLDRGDFIVTYMNLCEKELTKSIVDVIQGRLEGLLDLALRLSSADGDPYKEDLKTELLPFNLQYQMFKIISIEAHSEQDNWMNLEPKKLSVIESFAFTYEVHWPLSLIFNKSTLACYQMLFRHLFYSKYVERLLCQVWRSNKVAKKFHHRDAMHYREAFVLRQKMLQCVQNLEYHMMVEVIEPHWCLFLEKINKVHNVDEILQCHSDFLGSCLKDCMLTIPTILNTVISILNTCVEFAKFMQNEGVIQPSSDEEGLNMSFKDSVHHFDESFLRAIRTLLAQISELNRDTSEHDRLFNLLHRLDFNSFYTSVSIVGNSSG